jgi:hypothetical protein
MEAGPHEELFVAISLTVPADPKSLPSTATLLERLPLLARTHLL